MTARVRLMMGLLLVTATSYALAVELPAVPERRFSDRAVVDCLKQRTAGMDARLKALEEQSNSLRRANTSIAPIVLQHRRLEEEWCTAEAQCASEAVKENKQFIYGETFSFCFRH